jgi:hypothetical protein
MIGFLAESGAATPPPAQNNFGDTLGDGIAGPLALLIIVLLAVATVLLVRNMNARLRRLPESFPDPAGDPAKPAAAPAGATATSDESSGGGADSVDGGVPTGPVGPSGG